MIVSNTLIGAYFLSIWSRNYVPRGAGWAAPSAPKYRLLSTYPSHLPRYWTQNWNINLRLICVVLSNFPINIVMDCSIEIYRQSSTSSNFVQNRSNCTCPLLWTITKVFSGGKPWQSPMFKQPLALSRMRNCPMTMLLIPYCYAPQC